MGIGKKVKNSVGVGKAERRKGTASRARLSCQMKQDTLRKLVEYLEDHQDKIYSTWVFATHEAAAQDGTLENDSPAWHDTYSSWHVIPRYFHSGVIIEFALKNRCERVSKDVVDLIDAARPGQLKQMAANLFGFSLESVFPRKLIKKVIMKRWMLARGEELQGRLDRILASLDSEYKIDWWEATELLMHWSEDGVVTHISLKSKGPASKVALPASMKVDKSWTAKNLHDDCRASLESPDGFSKPLFRDILRKFATGEAADLVKEHFSFFDALRTKYMADLHAKEHDEMEKAVVYEATPTFLKTAAAKRVAKVKAKRAPPKAAAAVQLKVQKS